MKNIHGPFYLDILAKGIYIYVYIYIGVCVCVCVYTGVHTDVHTAPGLVIMTVLAPHVATTACLKSSNFTCTSTMNKTGG